MKIETLLGKYTVDVYNKAGVYHLVVCVYTYIYECIACVSWEL